MKQASFAIVVDEVRGGGRSLVRTPLARRMLPTAVGGRRVPLRLTWLRNPGTGRIEGAWQVASQEESSRLRRASIMTSLLERPRMTGCF